MPQIYETMLKIINNKEVVQTETAVRFSFHVSNGWKEEIHNA